MKVSIQFFFRLVVSVLGLGLAGYAATRQVRAESQIAGPATVPAAGAAVAVADAAAMCIFQGPLEKTTVGGGGWNWTVRPVRVFRGDVAGRVVVPLLGVSDLPVPPPFLRDAPLRFVAGHTFLVVAAATNHDAVPISRLSSSQLVGLFDLEEDDEARAFRSAYSGMPKPTFELEGISRLPCGRPFVSLDKDGLAALESSVAALVRDGRLSTLDLLRLWGRPDAVEDAPAAAGVGPSLVFTYFVRSPKLAVTESYEHSTRTTLPAFHITVRSGRVTRAEAFEATGWELRRFVE